MQATLREGDAVVSTRTLHNFHVKGWDAGRATPPPDLIVCSSFVS